MTYLKSIPFEKIKIGQMATISKKIRKQDIEAFAIITGDINPLHLDKEYAKKDRFKKLIAHGLFGQTLISAVLGTKCPGPGTIFLNQTVDFHKPVFLNDTIQAIVTVKAKEKKHNIITFDTICVNQHGIPVISGIAKVMIPKEAVKVSKPKLGKIKII